MHGYELFVAKALYYSLDLTHMKGWPNIEVSDGLIKGGNSLTILGTWLPHCLISRRLTSDVSACINLVPIIRNPVDLLSARA